MIRRVGLVVILALMALSVVPSGTPVQLSYVYSDSMEPTLDVNDGYVLVPAGKISTGDIITFRSEKQDSYVTHRVVRQTENGFITKGDNNPTIDQQAGYTIVTREEVIGEVLILGGSPLIIPNLGVVIEFLRMHRWGVVIGILGLMGFYAIRQSNSARQRNLTRLSDIFQPIFGVAFLSITALLAYGGSGHEITLIATSNAGLSETPQVIPVGSSKQIEFTIRQQALPMMTRIIETQGLVVTSQTWNASAVSATGTVPPPESIGPVRVSISINQYPSVLPRSTLKHLQTIHPVVASGTTATIILMPLWIVYRVSFDRHMPLREHSSGFSKRIRGHFK
ncbi:MAG: signal peptidase I [Halobacteriaceae archaeon]